MYYISMCLCLYLCLCVHILVCGIVRIGLQPLLQAQGL